MDKCLMNFQEVSLNAKRVFGEKYIVEKIGRLYGGAQKGTYKVQCINGFTFEDYYKYLDEENLDKDRMKFYKFYHHIGCLSGALKLTKKNYYNMQDVNHMINYNLKQLLTFVL